MINTHEMITQEKKYKNVVISLGLIASWTLIIFILFYRDANGLGKSFGVSVMYILTRNVAIVAAVICLLLRIFRVMKSNTNLLYILVGMLNLCTGVLCNVMYFLNQVDMQWLNQCLLNLLVGVLVLADTFFLKGILKNGDY